MQLPIMEQGRSKLVKINEGEVFLLPKMIPHSPQVGSGRCKLTRSAI
jgi:hypothetical protein